MMLGGEPLTKVPRWQVSCPVAAGLRLCPGRVRRGSGFQAEEGVLGPHVTEERRKLESGRGLVRTANRSVAESEPEHWSDTLVALCSSACQPEVQAPATRELFTLQTVWAHPLCTRGGSLPLGSFQSPFPVPVEGPLSCSRAPASTPAVTPAVPGPLLGVRSDC